MMEIGGDYLLGSAIHLTAMVVVMGIIFIVFLRLAYIFLKS